MRKHGRLLIVLASAAFLLGGCPVPQDQNTRESERLVTCTATGTNYWLFVPYHYDHRRPMPLIVTCHGTPPYDVSNMHIRELKKEAEMKGCIVVAPELIATDGIFGDGPVVGMIEDERRILGIISSLMYRYNIDRNNIMITGFSGGGFPAYWVGLRNPDIFSAIAARNCNFSPDNVQNWYPPEAKDVRILIYYGENDPGTISIQSRIAIDFLRERGFNVSTTTIPGAGHERHPEIAMKFFMEGLRPPRASLPESPTATATR